MRRTIPLLAMTAALALTLTACGGSGDDTSDDPTETTPPAAGDNTLTIWADDTRIGPLQEAADAFAEENDITVEVVERNYGDIRADFIAQVPTGEGPDITVGAHDWLGELVNNGVVAPVELGDVADGFEDVAIDAFTYDGQVYGLPYSIENVALIRNTDLAPDAPATWDEAIAMGQAAGTRFPILVQSGDENEGDPYTFYGFQTSFGAPVFEQNEDGSYDTTIAMGGEGGAAYANWLAEQGAAGTLNADINYDLAVENFAAGEAPFVVGGPWMLPSFEGMNLAIDPIPAAGDQPAQPFAGVAGFFISAQSQNALLANDFLVNYMASEEQQMALFEAAGRPPALTSAADAVSDDPIVAGFRAVGADAVPMPSIPEMASVWQFWGVSMRNIMTGTAADPAAAWEEMIASIQGAIDG